MIARTTAQFVLNLSAKQAARMTTCRIGVVFALFCTTSNPLFGQALPQEAIGLTGYLSASTSMGAPPAGFEYGYSAYSAVHRLSEVQYQGTQLGWGTWLRPDNRTFTGALCPIGTYARDHWPQDGPTYWYNYQNIEGGGGQWMSTQFPTGVPKFRMNATPDCYTSQVSSTGWLWGSTEKLPPRLLNIAQLSNRLLTPPDGITMADGDEQALLGYGWIALPLIQAGTSPLGIPTGNQSWTLFLHATNMKGPVAFYTPETWSAINAMDETGIGRGLDAMPAMFNEMAVEINTMPMFTSEDGSGNRWRRIPRIYFPADDNEQSVIVQDVRHYGKSAIWNSMASAIENSLPAPQFDESGSAPATMEWPNFQLTLGGAPVTPDASFTAGVIETSAGGPALGLTWSGDMEPGVFPEYFREATGSWIPVPAAEVPDETRLKEQSFAPAPGGAIPDLDQSASSPWTIANWSAGPFSAKLNDGSTVDYVWYKFIDQPAIQRLALSDAERSKLQTFVEALHANSAITGPVFAAPTSGTLATLDAAQLVVPPAGLEVGYVPVVISQYLPVPDIELNALAAFYNSTGGAHWTNNTNWLSGNPGAWYGVTVDGGKVTSLELPGNNLTGVISPEIGKLTSVEKIELSQNHLTGTLPSGIGQLMDLTFFSAYNNELTGNIPSQFGDLSELTLLQLGSNQLSGSVPPEFGQLTKLKHLFIQNNGLSGPLPLTLQNATSLISFTFQGTALCEPSDEAFRAWLHAIPELVSTDVECVTTSIALPERGEEFLLNQNPNPVSTSTTISFDLLEASFVSLKVFDRLGRESATLFFENLPAGKHSKQWRAENRPDGLYFVRLQVGSYSETRKLLLLR